MSAYVIVELEVTNQEEYAAYGKLAEASVARHGGRFLVRGGEFAYRRLLGLFTLANGRPGSSSSSSSPSTPSGAGTTLTTTRPASRCASPPPKAG